MKVVAKVNAELLFTKYIILELGESQWEQQLDLKLVKKKCLYVAGSEILELAAVTVCRYRQYQKVQKGIRWAFG